MGFGAFDLEQLTCFDEQGVSLLVRQAQVGEKSYESGQLVKHEILVVLKVYFLLFVFGLQHSLQCFIGQVTDALQR